MFMLFWRDEELVPGHQVLSWSLLRYLYIINDQHVFRKNFRFFLKENPFFIGSSCQKKGSSNFLCITGLGARFVR